MSLCAITSIAFFTAIKIATEKKAKEAIIQNAEIELNFASEKIRNLIQSSGYSPDGIIATFNDGGIIKTINNCLITTSKNGKGEQEYTSIFSENGAVMASRVRDSADICGGGVRLMDQNSFKTNMDFTVHSESVNTNSGLKKITVVKVALQAFTDKKTISTKNISVTNKQT